MGPAVDLKAPLLHSRHSLFCCSLQVNCKYLLLCMQTNRFHAVAFHHSGKNSKRKFFVHPIGNILVVVFMNSSQLLFETLNEGIT
jgi:hypothetical protein